MTLRTPACSGLNEAIGELFLCSEGLRDINKDSSFDGCGNSLGEGNTVKFLS